MIKESLKKATTELFSSLTPLPGEYPDWPNILWANSGRWKSALAAAKNGPKVLIANSAGRDRAATIVDSLLAVALTLRGANVHILLCDEALPACWMSGRDQIAPDEFATTGPSHQLCSQCFLPGYKVFHSLGLPIHRYGDLISNKDLKQASEWSSTVSVDNIGKLYWDGTKVGEHALAAALRFYTRGSLESGPIPEAVLRRFLNASLITVAVIRRLLSSYSFSCVSAVHGIYVPEGLVGEVARQRQVRFATWGPAYRRHCFVFSHGDTYHHTMLSEPVSHWDKIPWTPKMESAIVEYLKSRWYGTRDWIGYVGDWVEDVLPIAAKLGIDFTKPCIGLLTNVIWDAQVHYGGNAFPNMIEWTLQTIRYFASRPDLQLLIRIHPAEVHGTLKSRQLMADEIKRAFPRLPSNVFVIEPDNPMNTYATMLKCNAVLIYGTKAGVELSSFGVPIIVAGEAWIRNKGLTLEASSAREYFAILDRLPIKEGLSEAAIQRARKYAYHFFFRRMIPLPFLAQTSGNSLFELKLAGIDDLLPGQSPGLDVICNGIIRGSEFIYPAELYMEDSAETSRFAATFSPKKFVAQFERPTVSVIIPTFNRAEDLKEALDSAYAQEGIGSQFDLEVIVIDDASSDSTLEVVSRYNGSRYIRLDKNVGSSAARNIGIKASRGKYIAFLDDDDLWLPQRLSCHLRILESHTEFGAVYGQYIANPSGKAIRCPDAANAPAGSVFRAFLMQEFVHSSCMIVRREAFEQAGYFDENFNGMGHYDMLLRLAFYVHFAFVSSPVAIVRFSRNSIRSKSIQEGRYQREVPCIIDKALALLPHNSETAVLRREVLSHWVLRIADCLDRGEELGLLREHLVRSLSEYPWIVTEPKLRDMLSVYATKVVFTCAVKSGLIFPAVRSFCQEVRSKQNGNKSKNVSGIQTFLGDTLSGTATRLWDSGCLKGAGYTASYAVLQDPTQVARQVWAVSRRVIRALLSHP